MTDDPVRQGLDYTGDDSLPDPRRERNGEEVNEEKCRLCGRPKPFARSMGGPDICSWCDGGGPASSYRAQLAQAQEALAAEKAAHEATREECNALRRAGAGILAQRVEIADWLLTAQTERDAALARAEKAEAACAMLEQETPRVCATCQSFSITGPSDFCSGCNREGYSNWKRNSSPGQPFLDRLRAAEAERDEAIACAAIRGVRDLIPDDIFLDRLRAAEEVVEKLHPRVLRLLTKGRGFIVIGEHEPYFRRAYDMIRQREQKMGTWTDDDEEHYARAVICWHDLQHAAAEAARAKETSDSRATDARDEQAMREED